VLDAQLDQATLRRVKVVVHRGLASGTGAGTQDGTTFHTDLPMRPRL
jgi:hypothetical protein